MSLLMPLEFGTAGDDGTPPAKVVGAETEGARLEISVEYLDGMPVSSVGIGPPKGGDGKLGNGVVVCLFGGQSMRKF